MWKFVSRRIKDSLERTYNVLESRPTWNCGGDKSSSAANSKKEEEQQLHHHRPINTCVFKSHTKGWTGSSSHSSTNDEHFKQSKRHYERPFQKNFLEALTWSSALVCGWYTSQILCMRRRHLQNGQCRLFSTFGTTCKSFQTNQILSSWVRTGIPIPAHPIAKTKAIQLSSKQRNESAFVQHLDAHKLFPVNNVSNSEDVVDSAPEVSTKNDKKSYNDAVQDLVKIIGDIEFQLGLANIDAERYATAVYHFKAGTEHHHMGATFNLGICYELGMGVQKNLKIAMECYEAAASMGHAKALYNLGTFYAKGIGGAVKNRKIARQYFLAAAKLGLVEAQEALGIKPVEVLPDANKDENKFPLQSAIYQEISVA